LLAEVGAAVYQQARGGGLYECRAAQSLVLGVGAAADFTLAAYRWHAARRACAEKCQSHLLFTDLLFTDLLFTDLLFTIYAISGGQIHYSLFTFHYSLFTIH
jgi:hypothetical protein